MNRMCELQEAHLATGHVSSAFTGGKEGATSTACSSRGLYVKCTLATAAGWCQGLTSKPVAHPSAAATRSATQETLVPSGMMLPGRCQHCDAERASWEAATK